MNQFFQNKKNMLKSAISLERIAECDPIISSAVKAE